MTIISILVGASIFIFGMHLMSGYLSTSLSDKFTEFLSKVTENRFFCIGAGAVITALMQSSSASTVTIAALADSKKISLYSALWTIIGANIGSTFTGFLTAANISELAPMFCIAGVVMTVFIKNEKISAAGYLFTGFGLLFVGMNTMESALSVIKSNEEILTIIGNAVSPLAGVFTGAIFTAIIQSSAATTAIIQTLASDSIINLSQAFYLLIGANIGTCATLLLASLSLKNTAKKVGAIHIIFNISGAVLFIILSLFFPLPELFEKIFTGNIKMQIAIINIVFNIVTAAGAVIFLRKKKSAPKTADNRIRVLTKA